MPSTSLRLLALLLVGLLTLPAGAQDRGGPGQYEARLDVPPPPSPPRLVNDLAGLLSPAEREALERKLVAFDDSTTTQIAVVIVQTTNGADAGEYATEVLRSWGVGRAGPDNGVVFLVAAGDRETFIATGLGTEGALTDARAGRIVRDVIVPRFRQGLFYGGIDEATDAMMAALAGEDFSGQTLPAQSDSSLGGVMCLLLVVFLLLVILSSRRGGPGSGTPSKSVPGGRRRRGPGVVVIPSFGGGGFGGGFGGGGGGFGGGGFGGFGGGFGGGGGAGGGW